MLKVIAAILAANPTALLTGSRALVLQGFKVRKEPNDIDIWIPEGTAFNLVPGMSYPKTKKQIEQEQREAELSRPTSESSSLTVAPTPSITLDNIRDAINQNKGLRAAIMKLLGKFGVPYTAALPVTDYKAFYRSLKDIPNFKIPLIKPLPKAVTGDEVLEMAEKGIDEDYGEADFHIVRYEIDGVKVEVHTGRQNEIRKPVATASQINCSSYIDILRAKMLFIRSTSPTKNKHRDDIMFFLVANFD